jgi:FAD/FMN-containing dehydrogenase
VKPRFFATPAHLRKWFEDNHATARELCYLGDDEPGDPVAAYGPNYRRLKKLKKKYDPQNFFHKNQNIRPV